MIVLDGEAENVPGGRKRCQESIFTAIFGRFSCSPCRESRDLVNVPEEERV